MTVESTPPSGTSIVTAAAYVSEAIDTPIIVEPQRAQSVAAWGAVAVGFAFSNTPVPLVLEPAPQVAYSTVSGGPSVGKNLLPVTATAIVQQSDTVTPPAPPPGPQLSFFWG